MRLTTALLAFAALCAPVAAGAQTIADADTKAWWAITKTLSSDAYEGRDTGSAGYARAADYVAKRFAAAACSRRGITGHSCSRCLCARSGWTATGRALS
jgi:hypothetical protein